jgi:hypothetical protein
LKQTRFFLGTLNGFPEGDRGEYDFRIDIVMALVIECHVLLILVFPLSAGYIDKYFRRVHYIRHCFGHYRQVQECMSLRQPTKYYKRPQDFRVLFVYPNIQMSALAPQSIGYLSAVLKRDGFTVDLFDSTFYASPI